MVEVAAAQPAIPAEWIDRWRVWASVSDHALKIGSRAESERALLGDIVAEARDRVLRHGDVIPDDLARWSVLEGVNVSDGFLRSQRLGVADILDVADGFIAMIAGTFAPDPPNGAWFLGAPGGRRVIPMRARDG